MDNELLKFALDNDIIDMSYVQEQINMKKKNEYLKKHNYKIYEGKDGKWYTYLPDYKKGRVLRKRKSREEIESLVVDYWKEQETNPTINDIFEEWMQNKVEREEISKSTRDRYQRQYTQCFTEFGIRDIKSVSEYDIEDFIFNSISRYKLTQKGFGNLRTIIFGIFKLAKKKQYISYSITEVVKDIEISRKTFRREIKSDDEQVFMIEEIPKITQYLMDNQDIINLGILLLFKTGLRIGELAALKKCDIQDNVIHVCRTEVCYENDGQRIFEVRDFPKTEAGIRDVVIPSSSQWILKKIKFNNPFGEYVFMRNSERIRTYVFRNRLRTICKQIGIKEKSPHKIRKTYGSILLDDGVAESLIVNQMGHTDIKTTREYYYKNRRNSEEIKKELDKIEEI